MVKVFLGTNVVIDLLGKRLPFYEDAKLFLTLAQKGLVKLFVAENGLGNLYYLAFEVYKIPHTNETMHVFFNLQCSFRRQGDYFSILEFRFQRQRRWTSIFYRNRQ